MHAGLGRSLPTSLARSPAHPCAPFPAFFSVPFFLFFRRAKHAGIGKRYNAPSEGTRKGHDGEGSSFRSLIVKTLGVGIHPSRARYVLTYRARVVRLPRLLLPRPVMGQVPPSLTWQDTQSRLLGMHAGACKRYTPRGWHILLRHGSPDPHLPSRAGQSWDYNIRGGVTCFRQPVRNGASGHELQE